MRFYFVCWTALGVSLELSWERPLLSWGFLGRPGVLKCRKHVLESVCFRYPSFLGSLVGAILARVLEVFETNMGMFEDGIALRLMGNYWEWYLQAIPEIFRSIEYEFQDTFFFKCLSLT